MLDHLATPLGFEVREDSLFAAERPRELANYLVRRRGMLTSNIAEAYGFIRSQPALVLPNLELLFAPAPFVDEGLRTPSAHAVVIGAILLKPESRGYVALRSADPFAKPIIDPRYLSDPDGRDRAAMFGRTACLRRHHLWHSWNWVGTGIYCLVASNHKIVATPPEGTGKTGLLR